MSITLSNVSLTVSGVDYLKNINASFPRKGLTTVLGRTLSGKTTLMRAIAGLQMIDSGEIYRDKQAFSSLPAWERDVAMVYQQFINYPHLTVFENIAFPLRKQGVDKDKVSSRVKSALAMVGLSDFGDRKPSALSGGQQQRVALARALVRRAGILLLDEPLVNLDYKLREQLREEFRELIATQENTIVIYNTTEPAEAMMLGDHMIIMHEGAILQAGTPAEIFEQPANITVARIVNDPPMTLFEGYIRDGLVGFSSNHSIPVPQHLSDLSGDRFRFGIRATDFNLASDGGIPGKVTFSEVSGSETFIHLNTASGEAIVQIEGVQDFAIGKILRLSSNPDRLFVFAKNENGDLIRSPHGRNH